MKSQQGFAFIAGTAWLAAAVATGGFVAAVESGTNDETTATAQSQAQPSNTVAAVSPSPQESSAIQQTGYVGTSWSADQDGDHYFDQ
jgi:hypothetical protein